MIVTAGVEPGEAAELIRAGVSGIFLKLESADRLVEAIREARAGNVLFDQTLFRQAMAQTAGSAESSRGRFTERERHVLSGVCRRAQSRRRVGTV